MPPPSDAPFPLISRHGPEGTHSFENLDTFGKHFYRFEIKKLDFDAVPAGEATPKVMFDALPKAEINSWTDSMDSVAAARSRSIITGGISSGYISRTELTNFCEFFRPAPAYRRC